MLENKIKLFIYFKESIEKKHKQNKNVLNVEKI